MTDYQKMIAARKAASKKSASAMYTQVQPKSKQAAAPRKSSSLMDQIRREARRDREEAKYAYEAGVRDYQTYADIAAGY